MNLLKNLVCAVSMSLFAVPAFASYSDCGSLVGTYIPAGGSTPYDQIRISLDATHVVITYNDPDGPDHDGYRVALIPDGREHPGENPMNEGKSYAATCVPNQLTLTRYDLLKAPLTTVLDLHDGNFLNYTDKFEGLPMANLGQYFRKP